MVDDDKAGVERETMQEKIVEGLEEAREKIAFDTTLVASVAVGGEDEGEEGEIREVVVGGLEAMSKGKDSPMLDTLSKPASPKAASPRSTSLQPTSSSSLQTSSTILSPPTASSSLPAAPPAVDAKPRPLNPSCLIGQIVYYPSRFGRYVPTAQLKRERWTDASNKFDEEVGDDEMDWSDDEQEMAAKKRRKNARASSRAGSVRPASPTGSSRSGMGVGGGGGSVRGDHFDYAPTAEYAASSYAGSAYGSDGE
jgi:hypothetical protein